MNFEIPPGVTLTKENIVEYLMTRAKVLEDLERKEKDVMLVILELPGEFTKEMEIQNKAGEQGEILIALPPPVQELYKKNGYKEDTEFQCMHFVYHHMNLDKNIPVYRLSM